MVQVGEIFAIEAELAAEHAVDVIGVAIVERGTRPRILARRRNPSTSASRVVPAERGRLSAGARHGMDELERAGQARLLTRREVPGGAPDGSRNQRPRSDCSVHRPGTVLAEQGGDDPRPQGDAIVNQRIPHVLAAALSLLTLTAAGSAFAGPATNAVKGNQAALFALIQQGGAGTQPKIDALVDDMIDYQALAQSSLGPEWAPRTAAEQAEFTDLLTKLVRRSYQRSLKQIATPATTCATWSEVPVVGAGGFPRHQPGRLEDRCARGRCRDRVQSSS